MDEPVERDWTKKSTDEPIWEGPRAAEDVDLSGLSVDSREKASTILEAMEGTQFVIFLYGESDRVVAPFALGVSSKGNPLLRGYQVEGLSLSGKGPGWRVFQIEKMERVENFEEPFYPDEFEFDGIYPWIYKVLKML